MEIKIEKKANVEARTEKEPSAGGIRITGAADMDADVLVGTVVVELFSVDAVVRIEARPEDLERAGQLMASLRRRFDTRDVCIDHGYYGSKRPHYDCPVCGKNASVVADAAAPLKLAADPF